MSQSRQLAAIMFTDIVSYTALMGEDESKAFQLLKKNRQVQRPIIEKFSGKWLKEIGDGVLASFTTVSDAINCAIEIQKTCDEEPDLKLRIGIHQGEVVFEGNDVFGDGVNIASRLEPLAPVGGILVSESVHRNIRNKPNINTVFQGEEHLRGVKDAVRTYRILINGEEPTITERLDATREAKSTSTGLLKVILGVIGLLLIAAALFLILNSSERAEMAGVEIILDKSIAVIPFENLSNNPEQEYFSDGITEDILNNLAKIAELKVKSRTSTLQYKGTTKTIPQIGSELGVAHILEGSIRRSGNKVRITAQLIDVNTDEHIWSEIYDRELTEIFEVQSEVALAISRVLQAKLTNSETENVNPRGTVDTRSYENLLKARGIIENWSTESDLDNALRLLQQAVALDPEYAPAYAEMANILYDDKRRFGISRELWVDSAFALANKAIELDPNNVRAYEVRSDILYRVFQDPEKARQDLETAYAIAPNDPIIMNELGVLLTEEEGRYLEGATLRVDAIERRFNRNDPRYFSALGNHYAQIRAWDKAYLLQRRALELNPERILSWQQLGLTAWGSGNLLEAHDHFKKAWDLGNQENPRYLFWMAEMLLYTGELDRSQLLFDEIRAFEQSFADSTGLIPYRAKLVYLYKLRGEAEKAEQLASETIKILEARIANSDPNLWDGSLADHYYHLGELYAVMGKAEKAMDLLEDDENWIWAGIATKYRWIENHPLFDPIRDSPQFQRFEEDTRAKYEAFEKATQQVLIEKEMNWKFALEQGR